MNVGVLGGGQLGRMLALAGYPLGMRFSFLDPSPDAPAGHVGRLIVAAFDDEAALRELASGADVVTYEFEQVPVASALLVKEMVPIYPPPVALEVTQDRVAEKQMFDRLGLATAGFAAITSAEDISGAIDQVVLPAIVKTRSGGYDGKGQSVVHDEEQALQAFESFGRVPCILESKVSFDRELSIIGVRAADGETAFYPLVENHHEGGILRETVAPAPGIEGRMQGDAESFAGKVMQDLDHCGVLAIELFEVGGKLLGNEMAPRVHNSGHWTIEGAVTSQFENHLRAIAGLPLGSTEVVGPSVMKNIIGEMPPLSELAAMKNCHVHIYGKSPRPGRKLGHITTVTRS